MTKTSPWGGRFAAFLLVPVGLLPLLFAGQRSLPHVPAPRFQDWSTRHAIYSQTGTSDALEAARRDPRALFRWHEAEQREFQRRQTRSFAQFGRYRPPRRFPHSSPVSIQRDWSINLGTAGTAPAMYPAKFGFDVTSTPDCTKDFVVFPVNAAGSATQPNIVAFNNLYSGTTGGTGICNRAVTGNDKGITATVLWSYNVNAIGGAVTTSPVISFDATGSKIAFVESVAGKPAHFHVLAWKSGDGKVANAQNVLNPKVIVAPFSITAPAAGSGTATDLALGALTTGTDTLSSPYIDYSNDLAYVGNDIGVVYRIKNVFCTTAACGNAAPSLDTTWGTGGAVTIGGTCTGQLTAPVLDFYNLNVYVGCSDGKLYSISQTGTIKSLVVGDGVTAKAFGAVVDAPLVDGVNGFVYAVSGSANNGANGVLVQAKADMSSSIAALIGSGNQCNIHAPTPNNAYFTSPTAAGALMYVAGTTGTVGPCTATGATAGTGDIFAATFTATGIMTAGAPANKTTGLANPGNEFAPMIEFFNPHIGAGTDLLFFAVLCTGSDMASYNITAGLPNTATFFAAPITEGFGTSGIVVDNSALTTAGNFPQAASFYFNALGENVACTGNTGGNNTPGTQGCAVKLTQAALQ